MINEFGNSGPGSIPYAVAEKRTQTGADWFFWIAGLSLISSIVILTGHSYHPVVGLGTTEAISEYAASAGAAGQSSGKIIGLLLDLLAAGFYVLYGFFGRKGAKWAFLTGMVFYALDAVLLLFVSAFLGAAFHVYALFRIFQGFQAAQQLSVLRTQPGPAAPGVHGYAPPSPVPSSEVWPPPPTV